MAKNGMEFSGHGSEVRERSSSSIGELVASGFIDESGQLTERTRRAIPRGGVEIVTPVQIQKCEEPTQVDPYLSREMQEPYRVVAGGTLLGGCLVSNILLEAKYNDRASRRGYIIMCQNPMLVYIMRQLEDISRRDQRTKLTLRSMGALGLGSFITGGGVSLLSSGEPLLSAAGAIVGGAVGTVGAQLAEKKWFKEQVTRFSQAIHSCPDNIIIDLDNINSGLASRTLWRAAGSDWPSLMRKINPDHTYFDHWYIDQQRLTTRDFWFIFSTPQYSSAALTFADKYQKYQAVYDAIQREWEAQEARDSIGMITDYGQLKTQQSHADEFLSTALLQLFDDVRELGQEEQSRREFNTTIERLTTVTEAEIKYQPAKVFHDELMRSLSGDMLMGLDEREQGVCIQAVQWAMEFIDKLPRMITPSLSIHEAYDHFQGKIKGMTYGKLTLPTTEQFQQKYPGIDQGIV